MPIGKQPETDNKDQRKAKHYCLPSANGAPFAGPQPVPLPREMEPEASTLLFASVPASKSDVGVAACTENVLFA